MYQYLIADDVLIKNHQTYSDKLLDFLKDVKCMCVQFSIAYKIIEGIEEKNDVAYIKKLVYSPSNDVLYVYISNSDFANFLATRLLHTMYLVFAFGWSNEQDDNRKKCFVQEFENGMCVLELAFQNSEVKDRNKLYELNELISI